MATNGLHRETAVGQADRAAGTTLEVVSRVALVILKGSTSRREFKIGASMSDSRTMSACAQQCAP